MATVERPAITNTTVTGAPSAAAAAAAPSRAALPRALATSTDRRDARSPINPPNGAARAPGSSRTAPATPTAVGPLASNA